MEQLVLFQHIKHAFLWHALGGVNIADRFLSGVVFLLFLQQ